MQADHRIASFVYTGSVFEQDVMTLSASCHGARKRPWQIFFFLYKLSESFVSSLSILCFVAHFLFFVLAYNWHKFVAPIISELTDAYLMVFDRRKHVANIKTPNTRHITQMGQNDKATTLNAPGGCSVVVNMGQHEDCAGEQQAVMHRVLGPWPALKFCQTSVYCNVKPTRWYFCCGWSV